MGKRYLATARQLWAPILPGGYRGLRRAHLGQCGRCAHREVTQARFGNGDTGEVHLCHARRTELAAEDAESATARRCGLFQAG